MTPGIGDGSRGVALATSFVLSLVFTALILAWLAFREGIFAGPETLDEQAERADATELDGWPFVDGGSKMRVKRFPRMRALKTVGGLRLGWAASGAFRLVY
jgi:hypothetical protein